MNNQKRKWPQFPKRYFQKPEKKSNQAKEKLDLNDYMSKIIPIKNQAEHALLNFWRKREEMQIYRQDMKVIQLHNQIDQLRQSSQQLQKYILIYDECMQNLKRHRQELAQMQQTQSQLEAQIIKKREQQKMILYKLQIAKQNYEKTQADVQQIRKKIQQYKLRNQKLDISNQIHRKKLIEQKLQVQSLKQELKQIIPIKKIYNNQLQQLKGNIRVYCRIRPLLSIKEGNLMRYETTDASLKIVIPEHLLKSKNNQSQYSFSFQHIFDRSTTQIQLFQELTQLIQSSLSAKNVCIFTYGQTGSGKTYTMQGNGQNKQLKQQGIVQRSIRQIFQEQQKYKENYQMMFEMSAVQIYNNQYKDLFDYSSKENPAKNANFDCRKILIESAQQGLSNFKNVTSNRIVRSTGANQVSSRSHLIFTIHIQLKDKDKKVTNGSLTFVDLAGSQRISDSNVVGQRFKQTKFINGSLTNLKTVLSQIKSNNSHVSYRNDKLTLILQNYLKNHSKTVMFVNISSNQNDVYQTINSLNFASQVKDTVLQK